MLNRHFRILWFKLQLEEKRHFHIAFPIPLYIFQEILDCILDLLSVICFFAPKKQAEGFSFIVYVNMSKELIIMVMKLFDSVTESEPYDLVDVSVDKVKLSLKVR